MGEHARKELSKEKEESALAKVLNPTSVAEPGPESAAAAAPSWPTAKEQSRPTDHAPQPGPWSPHLPT